MPDRPRVIIANINPGHILAECVVGIINSLRTGTALSIAFAHSGPYLDSGRNKITAAVLASDLPWEWVLMVDSDIEFDSTHVDTLLAPTLHPSFSPAAYPVLSGVYVNTFDNDDVPGEEDDAPGNHMGPVIFEYTKVTNLHGELNGIPTPNFRRLARSSLATRAPVNEAWNPPGDDTTPSPVCEVDGVGAGFLAIHRDFLTKMADVYPEPLHWFHEPVTPHGVHLGEDFGFCLRVREMGYPVLVNRACTVLHHKTIKLL